MKPLNVKRFRSKWQSSFLVVGEFYGTKIQIKLCISVAGVSAMRETCDLVVLPWA